MTKKHFIELADTMREALDHRLLKYLGLDQKDFLLSSLADFCQSQNPRFDRDRWLGYIAGTCGPGGGKVK